MEPLRGPDAGTLLVRGLRILAAEAGVAVAVRSIASRPWGSATFTGTRHRLAVDAAAGDALDRWLRALPEATWTVHGHLVADLVIDRVAIDGDVAALQIAILTIEDN